ncbi:TetR/AcrR family transcriptional regulator [Streptomyces boncukensis]|uniref:TetR/AcrR family transcriptional regulator n=1 Tax=Streptomyces boncukensis TaxID=2711219 RepID=A0A6G4WW33_9ACTN|nr:TetR/AcrR family transcriptional regulator [Streptomyces boncukensis]NGO69062.1 TetR/AcrR family transcriptional regulator [Streptomyces boncukensis]
MSTERNEDLSWLIRSLDLLWGTERGPRPSRGPKPALTLDQIVSAAIRLANREGLAALSMRKVATELGVGTMSLYRYVPGKSVLINLMVDQVYEPGGAADAPPPGSEDWRATLERVALGSWELYITSPWLLQVNQARPVLGPNSLADLHYALEGLEGLGLTGQERVAVVVALDNLVVGAARSHVLYQQAAQQSGVTDEEFWSAQEPYLVRAMETGAYPRLAELPEDAFSMSGEETMRFGVAALLDGIERLIAARV